MNFWGLFNFDYGFGMNNWFMPSFSFNFNPFYNTQSFFPSYHFPTFDFSGSFWNYTPTYSCTPTTQNYNKPSTTAKTNDFVFDSISTPVVSKPTLNTPKLGLNVTKVNIGLNLDGYDANAGKRLANIALNNSTGWTGYCAKSVKKAISQANLGTYQRGHAYQMSSILRNNSNFKEISADTVNVKDLPAGCVLVYGKGKEGYSSDYGHTEITTGDGRAVSDGITKNLHKKPSAIFMPVEHNYLA